jgi:hypothetical protein
MTCGLDQKGGDDSKESESRGLAEFHAEFEELMNSKELAHLVRVVDYVERMVRRKGDWRRYPLSKFCSDRDRRQ